MKVGTDGVLLGAWAEVGDARRLLDVGTGSGLVALMLAQRFPKVEITALEIDDQAARQAKENVEQSPFAKQIHVVAEDFNTYSDERFDAIVSNPPFFEENLLPPDVARAHARHTAAGLNFEALVAQSAALLAMGGSLQIIIPKNAQTCFHNICNRYNLTLLRAMDVRTVERKEPKRVLLHFIKGNTSAPPLRSEIILMANGQRTASYSELCRDFYL